MVGVISVEAMASDGLKCSGLQVAGLCVKAAVGKWGEGRGQLLKERFVKRVMGLKSSFHSRNMHE